MQLCVEKWCVVIFIYLTIAISVSAQSCYKTSSKTTVGNQLLCSDYKGLLKYDEEEEVDILSFSKNHITTIDSDSFNKELSAITELYLEYNELSDITGEAFKNLPNLKIIDLSYNNIEFLNSATFSSNEKLETIYLSGNKIKTVNVTVIEGLPNLRYLELSENPLSCDCPTREALNYLDLNGIVKVTEKNCKEGVTEQCNDFVKRSLPLHSGSKDKDTKSMEITKEKVTSLVVVLLLMIALVALLIFIVYKLYHKITRKQKSYNKRQNEVPIGDLLSNDTLVTSADDENDYLIPTVPLHPSTYLEVLGSVKELNVTTLLPSKSNQQTLKYDTPYVHNTVVNDNSSKTRQEVMYNENEYHIYEELPEPRGFYKRNVLRNLRQPYGSVVLLKQPNPVS